jgi:phage terminase small subunit
MAEEMTDKQKLFVKEYMKDLNATQSAIRAGYSEDTARQIGSENLSKPYIQEAIEKEMKERTAKVEIDAEYVLKGLKKVAERCMQEEEVMKYDYEKKSLVGTGEYKFDSSGANKAFELLGKYLKLFTDKVESNVTFDKSPVNELIESIENIKNANKN